MAKNDNVKYWWIKLEINFFYTNAIDYLMSQKNGSQYVVLYQMLCLETANTNGKLATEIGSMIVKYDIEKIRRLTRYFDTDTIVVALELYKQLGLIYQENNGILAIAEHSNLVGYQTGAAKRMAEKRQEISSGNIAGTNVPKSIELRDKSKDIKNKDNKEKNTKKENYFKDIEVNDLFLEFLELRKSIKAKNTDRAIKNLLDILEPFNDKDKKELINKSITHSWKSIYPKNEKPKENYNDKLEKRWGDFIDENKS